MISPEGVQKSHDVDFYSKSTKGTIELIKSHADLVTQHCVFAQQLNHPLFLAGFKTDDQIGAAKQLIELESTLSSKGHEWLAQA